MADDPQVDPEKEALRQKIAQLEGERDGLQRDAAEGKNVGARLAKIEEQIAKLGESLAKADPTPPATPPAAPAPSLPTPPAAAAPAAPAGSAGAGAAEKPKHWWFE